MEGILALDPAGPVFDANSGSTRLGKSDAKAVQVFHTNIRALGIEAPSGDVDFYFNDGKHQPGCKDLACSHSYAPAFLEALNKRSGSKRFRFCRIIYVKSSTKIISSTQVSEQQQQGGG